MYSLILRTAAWLMLPVLMLFSLFLFLRGHNLPGGGFIGGLVAAAAILLQLVAFGPQGVRHFFPFKFRNVAALGLLIAAAAGLPGLLGGAGFLAGEWVTVTLPGLDESAKIGTPLLFDLGVYLVVVGMAVEVIMAVAEEEAWRGF